MRIDWARAGIGRQRGLPIAAVGLALCAAAAWVVGAPSATLGLFLVGAVASGAAVRGLRPGAASAAHYLDRAMGLPDVVACAWDRRDSDAPFDRLQRRDALSALGERWPPELPDRPGRAWLLLPLLWVGPLWALSASSGVNPPRAADPGAVAAATGDTRRATAGSDGVDGAGHAGPRQRRPSAPPPAAPEDSTPGEAPKPGGARRDPLEPASNRAGEDASQTVPRRVAGVGSAAGAVAAGAGGVSRVAVGDAFEGAEGAAAEDARAKALFAQPLDPGDPTWPARPYPTRYGPAITAWFARRGATEGEPR